MKPSREWIRHALIILLLLLLFLLLLRHPAYREAEPPWTPLPIDH
jgi:hypothetical protein